MPPQKDKLSPREASRQAIAARMAESANRKALEPVSPPPPVASSPPPVPPLPEPSRDAPNRPQSSAIEVLVAVPIELLVSVRAEPERAALGYSFFSNGLQAERGLVIVLNSDRLLVSRALAKSDVVIVAHLYAILVAENLALRHGQSPLVAELQNELVKGLYPHGFSLSQRFVDFASRLAISPLLAGLRELPIYGAQPPSDTPHLVATVTIEVSPEVEKDAPWKRLSRKWKRASAPSTGAGLPTDGKTEQPKEPAHG
jgi:hypothetical protein